MHPFNRPAGPIGSNAVAPMQATSSGMLVTANKLGAPPEVLDFKGYFKVESFPHNAVIYRPGDMSDRVYLLKSGRVRLMRVGRSGSRSVMSVLRSGDLFGELFRPDGAQVEELAIAAGEAEVWSIESRDFRTQLEARPALALDVIQAVADRARALHTRGLGLSCEEVPAPIRRTPPALSDERG